ncbi:response regulator, partial [Verrucomicrobiales bacterium]|nr:response regulator [Verrucomicrobiales bacterium]
FIGIEKDAEQFSEIIAYVEKSAEICLKLINQSGRNATATADAEVAQKPEPAPDEIRPLSRSNDEHRPGKLLVADDDPENRELMARLLEPYGHKLSFAVDGEDALEKIRADDYDAVLLDIQMPRKDGFEVLESLHDSGHLRQTPVIVVTGLQDESDAVRCIEIGAEDFLSRPIRPALLMARLNASLEKKRLRQKVFEQHFTPELARELARNPDPMKMKARNAEVTVLFCDIRKFSTISERLGPEQTIGWLSGVMGEFSTSVIENGGVLVDYTGDELLALWGAPNEDPDHAEKACNAALEISGKLEALNEKWRPIVKAETAIGIGVNTGQALVGNIGTYRKFKYGPLGTTVNLASRVQGATKYLRTPLLVTGNTREHLSWGFNTRRLCSVRVNNIREPVELFEIAPPGGSVEHWENLRDEYEAALDHFEKCQFRRASAILGDVLVKFPDDGPSLQLMSRVVDAMLRGQEGKIEEFDPIWELEGK